jgi:predicted ATPase
MLLTRLLVRNYKSLGKVDLELGSLAVFVGPNGSGKSNLLDALRFVSDALSVNLDYALRERGGINEVRRRSSGRPNNFRIELNLSLKRWGAKYAFDIEAVRGYDYQVAREECRVYSLETPLTQEHHFVVERGSLKEASPKLSAATTPQDLYLRAVSAERGFNEVFDFLTRIAVYNPNPAAIRNLQDPDAYPILRRDGSNLPGILRQMRAAPERLERVQEFLSKIVPGVTKVESVVLGPKETLHFFQRMDNKNDWRFYASSMSDGTLRALAVLVAAFQTAVTVAGVEEPEVALHPGSAFVLADALIEASESRQILLTTHSPDLLDHEHLSPDSLYMVGMRQGVSEVRPIPKEQKELIQHKLFTAGELLRQRQLELPVVQDALL